MARIVGGLATSHIPAIGGAIAKGLQEDPYWKPFFDGFPPIHRWLDEVEPEVVVVFYNDHGLNFFLDKMPTFAVGAAEAYHNADEGWGIPTLAPLAGDLDLSWHIIDHLVESEFDIVTCQEMLVDHGCRLPFELFWPGVDPAPVRVVPINVNTVQFPIPKASRVFRLGHAVGEAIESFERDVRVAVMATGGLSHQLEGKRAGFINKSFDLAFLDSLVTNPEWATRFTSLELVEQAGTQGVELLMWLAMRAAIGVASPSVRKVHSHYHIPISNTATGILALKTAA